MVVLRVADAPELDIVENGPNSSSSVRLPSMPWRHWVFPESVLFPTEGMHPLAGPSFNSLARPSHGAEDADTFQCPAMPVPTGPPATHACTLPTLRLALTALACPSSPLARASDGATESIAELSEDVDTFQRRSNTVNIVPRLSRSKSLDELYTESGEDTGGLDASISSSAAASGKEEPACFDTTPEHTDLGLDAVA
ncbi:hypothetical protein T484DRAFT_1895973 [Baffinella frigidus]|nr:hypothetical protein T484DRAFT_1895973 [Cryptophyta sp. CCMP2293]